MSRAVLLRLTAILLGLLLFWAGAELTCRLVFSQVVDYDVEMWRYARKVKVSGLTPGLRFEHRPNTRARLMGVNVAINSDGLRERALDRQKPFGTLRIAVIGDSITFGWGVPWDQTYPQRLESLLNQQRPFGPHVSFEVVNFGVGNYTAGDAAAMLQHKALGYDPDLVIYGAFINDAEIPQETVSGPSLLRHSLAAVLVWGRLDRLWRQLGLRDGYQEYYLGLYRQEGEGRQRVRNSIQKMAKLCRERQVPLVVALLPELHDLSSEPFADIKQFYRKTVVASDASFVDLSGSLPDNGRQRYWVSADDAHPNAEACDHYARAIAIELPWSEISPP